jgi:hypothetical protein
MSDIQDIEDRLKVDPSKLSDKELFTYLYYKTNNENINPDNIDNIPKYLKRICDSFAFMNIFANTSHYGQIVSLIIGSLIPFYYFFPRFYKMGIIGLIIGLSCFMGLVGKMSELYGGFFPNIQIIFIAVSFVIYFAFFIILNKLNHISLFLICAVISFLIITYILRLILLSPIDNNPYNNLRITSTKKNTNESDNTTILEEEQSATTLASNRPACNEYAKYDINIQAACLQVIKRYKLKLPSGNMLYNYFTSFSFIENTDKNIIYSDFFTNLFGPIIAIAVLWSIGFFLSKLKYYDFEYAESLIENGNEGISNLGNTSGVGIIENGIEGISNLGNTSKANTTENIPTESERENLNQNQPEGQNKSNKLNGNIEMIKQNGGAKNGNNSPGNNHNQNENNQDGNNHNQNNQPKNNNHNQNNQNNQHKNNNHNHNQNNQFGNNPNNNSNGNNLPINNTDKYYKEDIFSIIGMSEDSDKYLFCQANYVLPKEFNCDILIHEYIDKYNLETKLYNKVYKALTRITNEFLDEYNPRFRIPTEVDTNSNRRLKANKIIKSIKNILSDLDENIYNKFFPLFNERIDEYNEKLNELNNNLNRNNVITNQLNTVSNNGNQHPFNGPNSAESLQSLDENNINKKNYTKIYDDFIDSLKDIMTDSEINNNIPYNNDNNNAASTIGVENILKIPFKEKVKIEELLNHISNELIIENELDKNYKKNFDIYIELAKNVIMADDEIKKRDRNKIEEILENYKSNLLQNLGLKEENNINSIKNINNSKYKTGKLYGYFYNIIGYDIKFPDKINYFSKEAFKFILRLISMWILFAKPFGSGWFLSKCMLLNPTSDNGSYKGYIQDFKNMLTSKSMIWRYFLMGLDTSNIKIDEDENEVKPEGVEVETNYLKTLKDFGLTFLISLITIPLLISYNTSAFGFKANPTWVNLFIQIFAIINIFSNYYITKSIVADKNNDYTITPKSGGQKFLDFFRLSYRNFNILFLIIVFVLSICFIFIPL